MRRNSQQNDLQTINGTFRCNSCGGSTSVHNQVNPLPFCKYCGAPLPDLKKEIDEKFRIIQEKYTSEQNRETMQLQFKQQQKLLHQQAAEDRHTARVEHRRSLREAKVQAKAEQKRLEMQAREEARKRQHEMNKIGMILTIIVFALTIIAALSSMKR